MVSRESRTGFTRRWGHGLPVVDLADEQLPRQRRGIIQGGLVRQRRGVAVPAAKHGDQGCEVHGQDQVHRLSGMRPYGARQLVHSQARRHNFTVLNYTRL